MPPTTRSTFVIAVLMVAMGCQKSSDRAPEHGSSNLPVSDTVAIGPKPQATFDSAAGSIIHRREPQRLLDTARALFREGAFANAAGELRAAAAYFRSVRDSTPAVMREHVHGTELALDSLARRVARGGELSLRQFDATLSRANRTESERHLVRSTEAWVLRDTIRAAEELLMAVDHLERAAKDGARALDRADRATLAEAQQLGTDLLRHAPLATRASMERVHADLGRAIERLGERTTGARPR